MALMVVDDSLLLQHIALPFRYVIYRVRVRRGGRKRQVTKGQTYGKPKTHGVNQLKNARSHQAIAEARFGRRCGSLRVLNSYCVGQDTSFMKSFCLIQLARFIRFYLTSLFYLKKREP
uniref:Ribosomal protein L15 n=1 Tax=Meloidogyne hapla TaxID=6305 RepID=A0A1I8BCC9_MELHA